MIMEGADDAHEARIEEVMMAGNPLVYKNYSALPEYYVCNRA